MNTFLKQTPAEHWQAMRLLRLLYVRLGREFALQVPACEELDAAIDVPTMEDMDAANRWFEAMDELIQVHQMRQFLQTTTGVNEETLVALIQYYIRKVTHSDADRDKVDFLLVQLLTQTSPAQIDERTVDGVFVSQGLEPVLGRVVPTVPDQLAAIETLITKARNCQTLNGIFTSGVLEAGRKLKVESGENYFFPGALVAFTRFNFILRRVFFRLMQEDINATLDGLQQLEGRGVAVLDARDAQFSEQESTAQLRMICQSWKILFQAEYASGQPMRILADLRAIVEKALLTGDKAPALRPKAKAAAAGAHAAHVPEFEVSAGSSGHES